MQSDEINDRAAVFVPPFSVSRQQVDYYRKTRSEDIQAIVRAGEQDALTEGLAQKGQRVRRLKQLAALMERDLLGGFLWLDQVKGVGSGDIAQIVDYEEFNKAEVDSYRGVLDDIAKEVGDRKQVQRHEGTGEDGAIKIDDARADYHARSLAALADSLGSLLADRHPAEPGAVDATEQATVGRGTESSG